MHTRAIIMSSCWINQWCRSILCERPASICIIQWSSYSPSTSVTYKPVCFTEYKGFDISGVLSVQKHMNCFRDQTKCTQYRKWLLFRGVHRAGFHFIWGTKIFVLYYLLWCLYVHTHTHTHTHTLLGSMIKPCKNSIWTVMFSTHWLKIQRLYTIPSL